MGARPEILLLLFLSECLVGCLFMWLSHGIHGEAPVSILCSSFKRLLNLLTGAVIRNQKVLGNVVLCACLLVSALWDCIVNPLLRETTCSE